ncbi:MAG: hypothetical protein IJ074_04645 [Clostridia bacterium]|nr:hypothetical protein [Clostridia bacterium]
MKHIRKVLSISLAACLTLSAPLALADTLERGALSESTIVETGKSGGKNPRGSMPEQQPRQDRGQNGRGFGQMPDSNGRNDRSGQIPDGNGANDRNGQNGTQTPPQQPNWPNGGANRGGAQPCPPSGNDLPQQPFDFNGGSNGDRRSMTPPDFQNDGEAQQGEGQTPPEMPADGQQPEDGQTPPEMPADGQLPEQGQMPGAPGQDSAPTEYAAANTLTEDTSGESYVSDADSENAVLVSDGEVKISDDTVSKTGSSDGESADFYGINAAVLASGGSTLTISGTTITSDGTHANGVFSYGSGTTVNVSDTEITTTGNNSGGLMTTGGATLNASDVTVSTSGNSSAAIRSDRGGGTVTVQGGSYSTSGVGSPAIYSTADITVSDATLTATSSEAIVIEGGNSVTLNDVDITGNDNVLNGQSTVNTNVLIYQSMSGDAADGSSSFTMNGGTMTSEAGCMFHVTNVTTTIDLAGVTFVNADDSGVFLSATQDSWGNAGKNGGIVTLKLSEQTVTGDIVTDSASSVTMSLTNGSSYTGAVNADDSGTVSVSIEEGSTWTLTADSHINSFEGELSSVNLNGYTLYVNGEAVA